MIRMSRADLDKLQGKTAPVEPAPAPAAPAPSMEKVEAALSALAGQQQQTAQALATLAARPKQLVADIERDEKGRMKRVIVNINHKE